MRHECQLLLAVAVGFATLATPAMARGDGGSKAGTSNYSGSHGASHSGGSHHGGGGHASHAGGAHSGSGHGGTPKAVGVARDPDGRIHRSQQAKDDFKKGHPCPSTGKTGGACPGYVIDHVKPLKRGGADSPSNMQWQTKQAAKAKDKTE